MSKKLNKASLPISNVLLSSAFNQDLKVLLQPSPQVGTKAWKVTLLPLLSSHCSLPIFHSRPLPTNLTSDSTK